MKEERRKFLKYAGAMAGISMFPVKSKANFLQWDELSLLPETEKDDEQFWMQIREMYTVSSNIINLNNGGVSPQPKPVQDAHIRYYQNCNEGPTYYMWRILDQGREPLRLKLAETAGCSADEIAINRNSTEGLNSIIFGLNLKKGDEVVLSKQDYPNMINAWKQREKRDGIVLKWVNLELPSENEAYMVNAYTSLFNDKTRLVHITHMINWNGQILPARKIADVAHSKGIEVLVDGAHTFAHLQYTIPELGADYYATSLHKWLGAPFGSGMMYIKKEKIKQVWALLSNNEPDGSDIRKFESLGTRSFASEMAIGQAIDFHNFIGAARKEKRLKFLKSYWCSKIKDIPGLSVHTPLNDLWSGAIAIVSVKGLTPAETESQLWEKSKIHCVAITWENISGVRITPNVYTTLSELDKLVNTLKQMASKSSEK